MKKIAAAAGLLLLAACSVANGADDWKMWNSYEFKLPV